METEKSPVLRCVLIFWLPAAISDSLSWTFLGVKTGCFQCHTQDGILKSEGLDHGNNLRASPSFLLHFLLQGSSAVLCSDTHTGWEVRGQGWALSLLCFPWGPQPKVRVYLSFGSSFRAALAQMVKNPPASAGDLGSTLGQEDPLEKEMATHSGILAWRIPWTEEPGRLQSAGSQRVRRDWATNTSLPSFYTCLVKGAQIREWMWKCYGTKLGSSTHAD